MESERAYLVQAGVLNVIGCDSLLSFDLHVDVHPYGTRHGRLICTLVWGERRDALEHRAFHFWLSRPTIAVMVSAR